MRSKIENASLIWGNNFLNQLLLLSKIQNNFLRLLCYQCNLQIISHSSYDIAHRFFTIMPFDKDTN